MLEVKTNGKSVKFEAPSASVPGGVINMVYAAWDEARSVDVPRTEKIEKGAVLAGKLAKTKPASIIHPVTKVVLSDPDYVFEDGLTIIDFQVPQPMSSHNAARDPLLTASEVLAFNPKTGELMVSNEFNDFTNYRMFSFADEIEEAAKAPRIQREETVHLVEWDQVAAERWAERWVVVSGVVENSVTWVFSS